MDRFGEVRAVVQEGGELPVWWWSDERIRRYVQDSGTPRVEWICDFGFPLDVLDDSDEELVAGEDGVDHWTPLATLDEHEERGRVWFGRSWVSVWTGDVSRLYQAAAADMVEALIHARLLSPGRWSNRAVSPDVVEQAMHTLDIRRAYARGQISANELLHGLWDEEPHQAFVTYSQDYAMYVCGAATHGAMLSHMMRACGYGDEQICKHDEVEAALLDHAERMLIRWAAGGKIKGERGGVL